MLPARTVGVEGRGEFFLRDSGGKGTPVMLLHGWMASADLNWWGAYGDLVCGLYRVLDIDHRGHGRALSPLTPFRMAYCADAAAAVLRSHDATQVLVGGFAMARAIDR